MQVQNDARSEWGSNIRGLPTVLRSLIVEHTDTGIADKHVQAVVLLLKSSGERGNRSEIAQVEDHDLAPSVAGLFPYLFVSEVSPISVRKEE
jgi:hypothetical protein